MIAGYFLRSYARTLTASYLDGGVEARIWLARKAA